MAIDEKTLSGEVYTVLSNRQTEKIALLAETLQTKELGEVSRHFGEAVKLVKTMTCDLSPSYRRYVQDTFPQAMRIADKFHIVKHALESLQAIRLRYKHQEMAAVAERKQQHKQEPPKMSNDETRLEMLHRSRYVLYKLSRTWTPSQQRRAKLLFRAYPELRQAYLLVEQLRVWYDRNNLGKASWKIAKELDRWYQKVDEAAIPELTALMKLIESHEEEITNYFRTGKTNAQAEALNNNLQRFVASNYGVRDRDFFLFRVAIYFS